MILLADVEANGLRPTKIHVICVKEYPSGKVMSFTNMDFFRVWVNGFKSRGIKVKWVFHNGLGYDVKVINDLVEKDLINPQDVVDTLVVSKLVNYPKFITHSLKELGIHLKVHKGDYNGGWEKYSEEMDEYCQQDVEVTHAVFDMLKKYIFDPNWKDALRLEHDIAWECRNLHDNGFEFDKAKAEGLLEGVLGEMKVLEDNFEAEFGSQLVEVKRLKARKKKDGEWVAVVQAAMESYPKTELDGDELVVYDYRKFNPGSPRDRIDVLWEAGWNPVEKTKGHIKKERELRTWGR